MMVPVILGKIMRLCQNYTWRLSIALDKPMKLYQSYAKKLPRSYITSQLYSARSESHIKSSSCYSISYSLNVVYSQILIYSRVLKASRIVLSINICNRREMPFLLPAFTSKSKMASCGKSKTFNHSQIFASTQSQPLLMSSLTPLLIQLYQGPRVEK